jgi:hypothetical protein
MSYWNIDDGDGTSLSEGIQSQSQARRIAQAHANRMRESVYLYAVDSAVAEEFRPEAGEL